MNGIPLQILVREGYRTGQAISSIARQLRDLGLDVTASGRATISARASTELFERLFGHAVPAASDTPLVANRQSEDSVELPIPAGLQHSIASISVAPRFIHMHRPEKRGDSR